MPFSTSAAKKKLLQILLDNHIPHEVKTWKNPTKEVIVKEAIILKICQEEELQRARKIILAFNQNENANQDVFMRDVAGGLDKQYSESYSMTPCAEADVLIQIIGELNHENNIRKIVLLDKEKKLVEVGANVSVEDVNTILYGNESSAFRLVLPTSSSIGKVSLIGLISNAGHGTGRDQPAVAGLVQGMKFCLPNGEIVRIVPPDEDNVEKETLSRDGIKTIKHPDFYDIRASSLGLFGTLLSVDVACSEAKKIQTIKEPRTYAELMNEIKGGLFTSDAPYVSVMIIPKYNASQQKNVCIRKQTPVPLSVPDSHSHSKLTNLQQKSVIGISSEAVPTTTLMSYEKYAIPDLMDIIAANQAPSCDTFQVGPWPEQMHFQTQFPHEIDNFDYLFEVSFDCHEIVETLEFMMALFEKYKTAEYPNSPVIFAGYLRVFAGTQGGLSTSHHDAEKLVCNFDIVSNRNIEGYLQFKKEMQDYFIQQRQAKPHWGKTVPLDVNYSEVYGAENRFEHFKEMLGRWLGKCDLTLEKNPVINHFFRRILNVAPTPAHNLFEEKEIKRNSVSYSLTDQNSLFAQRRNTMDSNPTSPKTEMEVLFLQIESAAFFLKAGNAKEQIPTPDEVKPTRLKCCTIL